MDAFQVSFGDPAKPHDPQERTASEWSARARRRPLAELVRRLESHGQR